MERWPPSVSHRIGEPGRFVLLPATCFPFETDREEEMLRGGGVTASIRRIVKHRQQKVPQPTENITARCMQTDEAVTLWAHLRESTRNIASSVILTYFSRELMEYVVMKCAPLHAIFFYEFYMETRHAFESKIISNLYSFRMIAG
jgi:hypothetical protein